MSGYILDPPLFPARVWYRCGETGDRAIRSLVGWANGGRVSPYGTRRHEEDGWDPGERGGRVDFESHLSGGRLRWTVKFARVGQPDSYGMCSGHSTAEDAAYSACNLIEQEERDVYEQRLVVGVA